VRFYVELMRPKHEGQVLVTRDYVVEGLKGVVESSVNDSARVAALKQLGQFLGMWVERSEVTGRDGAPLVGGRGDSGLGDVPVEVLRGVRDLLVSARKSGGDGDGDGDVRDVN
jgi:hypothetical protein